MVKGHIGRLHHHAGPVVHQAGEARAHGADVRQGDVSLLGGPAGQLGQKAAEGIAVQGAVYGLGDLVPDGARFLYQTGDQIGAAYVDPDIIAHCRPSFSAKSRSIF